MFKCTPPFLSILEIDEDSNGAGQKAIADKAPFWTWA